MSTEWTIEQQALLSLLRYSLKGKQVTDANDCESREITSPFVNHSPMRGKQDNTLPYADYLPLQEAQWVQVLNLARKHGVLPLLYDILEEDEEDPDALQGNHEISQNLLRSYVLPEALRQSFERECRGAVSKSYQLLFLTHYVVTLLKRQQVSCAVLKGVVAASFYPVSEYRKAGDVDLLVFGDGALNTAGEILEQNGFITAPENHANHHKTYLSKDGIEIELHGMLAEPFASRQVNLGMEQCMRECGRQLTEYDCCGLPLPGLTKPYEAYHLLLHMLQHFLYAGFGLKLLCDWVFLLRSPWSQKECEQFMELVKKSGLVSFERVITSVCIAYLGLEKQRDLFHFESCLEVEQQPDQKTEWEMDPQTIQEFMREILISGEFGEEDRSRMVVMKSAGIRGYISEFHHQMHLNFPQVGRLFFLWPVLWGITLLRFLINNRKLGRGSTKEILKEAQRRSLLAEKLELF